MRAFAAFAWARHIQLFWQLAYVFDRQFLLPYYDQDQQQQVKQFKSEAKLETGDAERTSEHHHDIMMMCWYVRVASACVVID